MTDREALAYHEAGHAVVAALLGLPSKSVSIIRSSSGDGRHVLSVPIGALPVWKVAVWVLAGPESEKFFRNAAHARLGAGDYMFARTLLEATQRAAEDVDMLGRRYEAMACAHVICHAKWIRIVGQQLLIERILPGHAVLDLRPEEE